MTKRSDKTIPTIAIVFTRNGTLDNCTTFDNDQEGLNLAEKTFKELAKQCDPNLNEHQINSHLEEGYIEFKDDTRIFITHT